MQFHHYITTYYFRLHFNFMELYKFYNKKLFNLKAQTARNTTWFTVFEVSDPDATTITVTGLVPFMLYRLRLIANNVVGASGPSEPTKEFQTIQAPPSHPPFNVTVRAMSATELRVRWIVSTSKYYFSRKKYKIIFFPVATTTSRMVWQSPRLQHNIQRSRQRTKSKRDN